MLSKRAALVVLALMLAAPAYAQQDTRAGEGAGRDTSQQGSDTQQASDTAAGEQQRAAGTPAQQTPEAPSRPVAKRFDIQFSVGTSYDTNAARFRGDSIDEFESGIFAPDRFRDSSVSDFNWVPRVLMTYSLTPPSRRTTRFYASLGTQQYVENSVRSYERFYVGFDQYFTDARDDLRMAERERAAYTEMPLAEGETRERVTSAAVRARRGFLLANTTKLRVRYSRAPDRFAGQAFDRDGGGRQASVYDYNSVQARWEQRLNTGTANRFRLDLTYRRDTFDYVVFFDERDSDTDRFFVGINYFRHEFLDNAFWQLGVEYERARRASNTAMLGTLGPAGAIVDDLSYDGNVVYLTVARSWYRDPGGIDLPRSNRLRLRARYGGKDFTSDDPVDRSHFLRSDRFWRMQLDYRHPFRSWVALDAGVDYARLTGSFEPRAGVEDPSDFDNLRVSLGATFYLTGWRSSR